jgi:site-specific DNA recombinase
MKKAVAYARFSSDNQRQESIDAQVRAINEYCQSNKITLLRINQDEAQSATSDQRDQFLQMIEDAEKHAFDFVMVHKLNRFARNRYDSAFYSASCDNMGQNLIGFRDSL